MCCGFHLAIERSFALPDVDEDFFTDLDGAFGPAVLLAFEAFHINGELGRSGDVVEEDEFPAFKLSSVG